MELSSQKEELSLGNIRKWKKPIESLAYDP